MDSLGGGTVGGGTVGRWLRFIRQNIFVPQNVLSTLGKSLKYRDTIKIFILIKQFFSFAFAVLSHSSKKDFLSKMNAALS